MSTFDTTVEQTVAPATTETPSIVRVLASADHKVIGRLLVAGALIATVATTVIGVLLGMERIDAEGTWLSGQALSALFAGYRVGLVLGAVVPFLLGVCVIAVPLQLGARALAFPRAAVLGFWTWFGGLVLLVISLFDNGGPNGTNPDMVRLYVASLGLMAIGLTVVAATVATSVLTTRAPGMKLHRVPLFSWSALVFGVGLVLVLPILLAVVVYLFFDVRYASADVSLFGGASGIDDWASWLLTGPSLALFAVPAVGFLAETIPVVFAKRVPNRSAALGGLALVGVGAIAAATQRSVIVLPGTGPAVDGHNWITKFGVFATWGILTLLPALGVLLVMSLIGLLGKPASKATRGAATTSKPRLVSPFLFGFFGTGFVLIGIVGAAVNGIEDLGLIGTVFEEGATVALVYGAILCGLGALAFWSPKWSGRRAADGPLSGLALLGGLGVLLASVPYLIAGFADQPGSAANFSYDGPSELWNIGVTAGHAVFGIVVLAFIGLLLRPGGTDPAGDDPWAGQTLEWATSSPAPAGNFTATPFVTSPEPLLDLKSSSVMVDQ